MDVKDKFIKFLDKNELLTLYTFNLSKKKTSIDDICNTDRPQDILINSFRWEDSLEGASFWSFVNSKWFKELTKAKSFRQQRFYIRRFKLFLKRNKCYYKFFYNFSMTGRSNAERFLEETDTQRFIELAFDWYWTDEGHYFWHRKNEKWKQYVKK